MGRFWPQLDERRPPLPRRSWSPLANSPANAPTRLQRDASPLSSRRTRCCACRSTCPTRCCAQTLQGNRPAPRHEAAAPGRAELVPIRVVDLSFGAHGLSVVLPRSKADQEGEGVTVHVAAQPAHRPIAWGGAARRRFALCQPEPLRQLFEEAWFSRVEVGAIEVPTVFRDSRATGRPSWRAGFQRRLTAYRSTRAVALL